MAKAQKAKKPHLCCYADCPTGTIAKGEPITWNRLAKGQFAHPDCFKRNGEIFPDQARPLPPITPSNNPVVDALLTSLTPRLRALIRDEVRDLLTEGLKKSS